MLKHYQHTSTKRDHSFYFNVYFLFLRIVVVTNLVRLILVIKFQFIYEPVHFIDREKWFTAILYVGHPFHSNPGQNLNLRGLNHAV